MYQITLKRRGHGGFYWLLVLLLVLISTRYALQIDIPRVVFLVVIVFTAFLGNRDEIIAMCMCFIPLHESIDFFYSIVFCLAIYILKYHKDIRVNLTVVPLLFMIVWELLHCWGEAFSIMSFLTDIVPLLALAVIMSMDVSTIDYAFVIRTMAVAAAAVCLTLLVKQLYFSDFNIALTVSGLQRLGMDTEEIKEQVIVSGGEINPNTLGIICVLVTTGLMQLRTAGCGRKKDVLLMCTLLVFGTLTSSRTYLVCLVLMVLLLALSQNGTLTEKIRFVGMLLLVLILALMVLWLVFPELLEYYYSRFFEDDLTTGRAGLMTVYHRFITENPPIFLFGIGLQDFGVRLTEVYRVASHVPHNGIQEMVIAWGMLGLMMFIVLLMMMIWRSRHFCSWQGLINYIPLLIILAKSQAGQLLNSSYTMFALSYAYLSLCNNFRRNGRHTGLNN